MLTDYIRAAMRHAHYELMENGQFFATIPRAAKGFGPKVQPWNRAVMNFKARRYRLVFDQANRGVGKYFAGGMGKCVS